MLIIAETDVKKDGRNRITLPASAEFDHYRVRTFDDGHLELYPQVLADPTISLHTLDMMDTAVANLERGDVGEPVDAEALLGVLGEE